MTTLRILIAGAGIAGLAAKRALALRGIDADLVERDAAPRITGAGLYLPGNAVRALRDLGLSEQLVGRSQPVLRQQLKDKRGRLLAEFPVGAIWSEVDDCVAMRRTDLHALLLGAVGSSQVRFGTGVREVSRDGTVTFRDGRQASYDLVVGADGLHSAVRLHAFADVQPRFLGQVCWRFLAPSATLPADAWTVMLGDRGRTFLSVPVGHGQAYCSAAMDSADPQRPTGNWRALFADFGAPASELLAYADNAHFAPLFEVSAFDRAHPRVALIGDAAHACSPSMSQATAMGMEDAIVLAETLTGARDGAEVPALLAAYRERRAGRLRFVLDQNHRRDRARHLPSPVRRVVFQHFAKEIFRANHKDLLTRP
ncbi:FAD-dependent monooxygenase [Paractinoplanes hotanensis]|uniref:FAD-dependent monooxygenase n=1 Tax=Paractinoplanes hotanensis TaxID=2906497 RepID=A0ABT0YBX3_9ACTN|nr:FAD-dependent monooxygenase [Actinoplanes hotanensis]MCM4083571.1 FAD-dependent monooxygenase [Actinoplanes hotanensis]